jgi:hypothetical protein
MADDFSFTEIEPLENDSGYTLHFYPKFSEALGEIEPTNVYKRTHGKHARRCLIRHLKEHPGGLIVSFRGVFYFLDVAELLEETGNEITTRHLHIPFRYSREHGNLSFSCLNLDGCTVKQLVQFALHSKSNTIVQQQAEKITKSSSSSDVLSQEQIEQFVQPLFLGLDHAPTMLELKDCAVFMCHSPTGGKNTPEVAVHLVLVAARLENSLYISQVFIANKHDEYKTWLPGMRRQLDDYCSDWNLGCGVQIGEYNILIPGTSTVVQQAYSVEVHAEIKKKCQNLSV